MSIRVLHLCYPHGLHGKFPCMNLSLGNYLSSSVHGINFFFCCIFFAYWIQQGIRKILQHITEIWLITWLTLIHTNNNLQPQLLLKRVLPLSLIWQHISGNIKSIDISVCFWILSISCLPLIITCLEFV